MAAAMSPELVRASATDLATAAVTAAVTSEVKSMELRSVALG